ncbi:hypothetical protein L195_g062890, partial [Trifolium pratense]
MQTETTEAVSFISEFVSNFILISADPSQRGLP